MRLLLSLSLSSLGGRRPLYPSFWLRPLAKTGEKKVARPSPPFYPRSCEPPFCDAPFALPPTSCQSLLWENERGTKKGDIFAKRGSSLFPHSSWRIECPICLAETNPESLLYGCLSPAAFSPFVALCLPIKANWEGERERGERN